MPAVICVLLAVSITALVWRVRVESTAAIGDTATVIAGELERSRGATELVAGGEDLREDLQAASGKRLEIAPPRAEPSTQAAVQVRGRVRDRDSGAPIPDTVITILELGDATSARVSPDHRSRFAGNLSGSGNGPGSGSDSITEFVRSDSQGRRTVRRSDGRWTEARELASTRSDSAGRFELSIVPGKRYLMAERQRRPTFEQVFDAPADRVTELDVAIESTWILPVELRGPDGSAIGEWLRAHPAERTTLRFDVTESDAPPPDRATRVELAVRKAGIVGVDEEKSVPAKVTLSLRSPWPRWVAAYDAGGELAASRLVREDEDRVELLIPERFLGRNTSDTTLRIVDAESGAPIAGARASLLPIGTFGTATVEGDPGGRLRFGSVQIGRMSLTVIARGREWIQEEVTIGPGPYTDLGVRSLAPKTSISGTIEPADGFPLRKVSLLAFPLDRFDERRRQREKFVYTSDALGRFAIAPVGRERYVLRCVDPDVTSDPVVVDTREGDVEGVVVRVSRGFAATFRLDRAVDGTLRVESTSGIPVREVELGGTREAVIRLSAGEYRWRLDSHGAVVFRGTVRSDADVSVDVVGSAR